MTAPLTARLTAVSVLALFGAGAVFAQSDDAEDAPAVYQVDVIVFQNLNEAASTETWPQLERREQEAAEPVAQEDIDELLQQLEPVNSLYYPSKGISGPDFFLLDVIPQPSPFKVLFGLNDNRRLNTEFEQLNTSGAYQPILYATWQQLAADKKTATAFDISAAGIPTDVLKGTFRLYQERYLHLEVDLKLPADSGRSGPDAPGYTMDQSRRLRNAGIQYFDHPKFSVIALVTELETAKKGATTASR